MQSIPSFLPIIERAAHRKGGRDTLMSLLGPAADTARLKASATIGRCR